MVCPRCIDSVREILKELEITIHHIQLGKIEINTILDEQQKENLNDKLKQKGFELLQEQKEKIIGQIKTIIIEQIHYPSRTLAVNFSTLLSESLEQEYSSLSKLFSSVEGLTIERFILKQKAERVKELLFYNELSLSEIAFQMNYSSVAHLSTQFKKETGLTPSAFKKMNTPGHNALDTI